jgi:hypothetical protein
VNPHVLQRARVQALLAFAVPSSVVAVATNVPAVSATPEQVLVVLGGFVVVVAGALALAFVRWLGRVEKNVPRDPERISDNLSALRREIRELRDEVHRVDTRVARIEGNLGQLVIMGGNQ